jgi:hypothetical protein
MIGLLVGGIASGVAQQNVTKLGEPQILTGFSRQGWEATNLDVHSRGIRPFAKHAKDPDFLLRGPGNRSVCGFL